MDPTAKQKFNSLALGRVSLPYDGGTLEESEFVLCSTVEKYLPEVVLAVNRARAADIKVLMFHQDAWAATYNVDEYTLTGMAVKYAGLHGLAFMVAGTNRETLKKDDQTPT